MPGNQRQRISRQATLTTRVVLCLLLLLVPAGQILVHTFVGSGLWHSLGLSGPNIDGTEQAIGILWNATDNLQYTSLAIQNTLGIVFIGNLYTTESHLNAFLNLYFVGVGALSKFLVIEPLALMTVISFAAAPIMGCMVFIICRRQLRFARETSLYATAVVIFGSGPSLVLRSINWCLSAIGIEYTIPVGIDFVYNDTFPVEAFLVYPYKSGALVLQILVFSAILEALRRDLTNYSFKWIIISAAGLAVFGLVRPYETFVFSALFPATLLLSRLIRGEGLLFRFRDYLTILITVGPSLCYILWLSYLPVWRTWAHTQFVMEGLSRAQFMIGLSAFWAIAIVGIVRAANERRLDLLIFCLWALSTMLLLTAFGLPVYKLAGGAVISYGILGAYGLEHLLGQLRVYLTKYRRHGLAIFRALVATAGALCIFATSLYSYYGMARSDHLPRIDTEILTAAALIKQESANRIRIVLAECSVGRALAALAAARVYSGHWAMTPDYGAKCTELELAGFGEQAISAPRPGESRLGDIVARTRPDFVVIRRGAPAERWLLDDYAVSVKMRGQRWSLLAMEK